MAKFNDGLDYERFAIRAAKRWWCPINGESKRFLETVLATAEARSTTLRKGERVWRARLGMAPPREEELADKSVAITFQPHPREGMKPMPGLRSRGRANRVGIMVLYAATDPDTAMSEVRPNRASDISLAELEIRQDLKLVDCSINIGRSWLEYKADPIPREEQEGAVWRSINDAFVRPLDPSTEVRDYVPTQILAEQFKRAGFDGIRYRTGYDTGGHNLALFDLAAADVEDRTLWRVQSVKFEFVPW